MRALLIYLAAGVIFLAGCGDDNGDRGGTSISDMLDDNGPTTSAEAIGGSGNAKPDPSDGPAAPELAPVYSAKITKVDVSASSNQRFNVEIIFTTAQGRDFTANVFSDDGALIYEESIDDVPDAYYAHVFAFEYQGNLEDLNVQVISPDEKTILDKWDL